MIKMINQENYEDFFSEVRNSQVFNEVMNTYDVQLVFLGGSRALGYANETSDYDVICWIDDPDLNLLYDNKNLKLSKYPHAHMFIHSIQASYGIFTEDPQFADWYGILLGIMQQVKPNHIIYQSERIHPLILFFWDNIQPLSEIALYKCLTYTKWDLQALAKTKEEGLDPKIYYYLISAYDAINHTQHKDLIHAIRQKRTKTEKQKEQFNTIINELWDFFENYDDNKYFTLKYEMEVLRHGYNQTNH